MRTNKNLCNKMDKDKKTTERDKTEIVVNRGMKATLMTKFKVSRQTVSIALKGNRHTPLHQAIRKEAERMVEEFMKQYE